MTFKPIDKSDIRISFDFAVLEMKKQVIDRFHLYCGSGVILSASVRYLQLMLSHVFNHVHTWFPVKKAEKLSELPFDRNNQLIDG